MTEQERLIKVGEALIEILNLKVDKQGRVITQWGSKSPEGLARTVIRVTEWKNREDFN